jgi:tRNA threonylcarbamoyladenosine biosynthesis protein TsaB
MLTLGISSATKVISVGLVDGGNIFFNIIEAADKLQSENLIEYIDSLLSRSGKNIKQIEAISVAQGPGSYGGLRGGLAAAKTLAQVIKVPIAGVSTLEAMAYNLIDAEGLIIAVLDAKKEEYNMALFGAGKNMINRKTEDFIISQGRLMQLAEEMPPEAMLATPVDLLRRKFANKRFKLASLSHSYPLGSNVAELGRKKILSGIKEDIFTLIPKYSHEPNIREFSKKAE